MARKWKSTSLSRLLPVDFGNEVCRTLAIRSEGIDGDDAGRQEQRCNRRAASAPLEALVRPAFRHRIAPHHVGVQVSHPVLGNAEFRIDVGFHSAIAFDRRIGDFHSQEDVLRTGMTRGIEVGARLEENQIGLGLVTEVQPHRSLWQHDGMVTRRSNQIASRAAHAGVVPRADRRHRDNFAVDELDAIALGQTANPGTRRSFYVQRRGPDGRICAARVRRKTWRSPQNGFGLLFTRRGRRAGMRRAQ